MVEIYKDVDRFFESFIKELTGLQIEAQVSDYKMGETVTCVRRIFYGAVDLTYGAPWDLLIPATTDLICPPAFQTEAELINSIAYLQANFQGLIQGKSVDMGHFFAGLDARLHPTEIQLLEGNIRFRSNFEAVTFVGDLGAVVLNYLFGAVGSFEQIARERKDRHLAQTFHLYAGPADLAADADAHILPLDPGRTLVENVCAWYEDPNSGQQERFTLFAREIGLGELIRGCFSGDEPAWREAVRYEIMQSAIAQAMVSGWEREAMLALENVGPGLPYGAPTFWEAFRNISGWVLDYFLDWMRLNVQLESE